MYAPRCVWPAANLLGEGPVWHEHEQAIYWVDIEQPRILRYGVASGAFDEFAMPAKIGCIAMRRSGGLGSGGLGSGDLGSGGLGSGGLVAGLQSGFALVDLASGSVTPLCDPEAAQPENRFNDGKCDAAGRFWAGTMHAPQQRDCGVLYRLDAAGQVQAMDDGYGITNGPAWSPDGTVMYHNDSKRRTVYAFECDPVAGTIHNKRVFVQLTAADGFPDGLTVDRDGGIWLAHWGGSRVTRFTPDGQVDRVIPLPVTQVTSCTFGGENLRTLFVTSARIGLSSAELTKQPLAGHLFAIDVDVAGLPANRFAG